MTIRAVAATEPRFDLAEGPLWDAARRRLLWVDITQGLVLVGRIDGDRVVVDEQHRFDGSVGSVALADDGTLLVAETTSLTRVGTDGTRTSLPVTAVLGERDRFNDGVCDAAGRFVVGTLSLSGDHRDQRLLQIGPGGTAVLDDDLGLANGLGFSPDGGTLYSVDSVPGTVWRRDYDHDTGAVGHRELLLDLSDHTPDGLAVDCDGRLWIAMWGLGEVRCYAPATRELEQTIAVPAPHTTSVAFVGDDLDRLAITTARSELSPARLEERPQSGSLFLATPGTRGVATHLWRDASH